MRKAFRMSVHPGREAEYARRHQPIWAELEAVLRAHGVREYSIFLDPDTGLRLERWGRAGSHQFL